MHMRTALRLIFVVSLAGLSFSAALTANEIRGASAVSCPAAGAPGTIFGYPACVYGFLMYLVIAALSFFGMRARD